MTLMRVVLLAVAVAPVAQATSMQMEMGANPIRKVVTMLTNMQAKITEEGKKAEELYEKFMCYCKTGVDDLALSIEDAKTKIPSLEAAVKEAVSKTAQLEKDLESHKADREAAKKSIAEATAIREKEAAEFAKEFGDVKTNLAALDKAISAISSGMGASFLQSGSANSVKAIAMARDHMLDSDRQELLSFLSGEQSSGYAPASGEILGILKTMKDEMSKESQEAIDAEEQGKKDFEEMSVAKKKEIAALSKMIEEKLNRVGELGVSTETMKNDLEDTQASLAEDTKFFAELKTNCGTKTAEWEEQKKTRAAEMTALADTIKILNDDDALDLFKKTLPSSAASSAASFLQVSRSASTLKARAMAALSKVGRPSRQLDFVLLALKGQKVGFGKIIGLIDELVGTLKAEQQADDEKKDYCSEEFDKSEDKQKSLERSLKDLTTVIAETKEGIATLTEEITALEKGIKALDTAVAEATEQRKEEHAEYSELMQSDSAAKEIILFAKNRLNKFYNPKLYKPPPKTDEALAFVQFKAKAKARAAAQEDEAPPPPPETFDAYTKKSEESNGVIGMMDMLVADLDKEMTEAEVEEKHAQKVYEETMQESAEKRAQDSKSVTDKEAAKAELQANLEESQAATKSTKKELYTLAKYIAGLHADCDWLMEYYDVRKEARADEIEALGKAKAVLNGADYSFLQVGHSARKLLRGQK